MATKPDITPELLRQLIRFDEASGKFFWRHRPVSLFSDEVSQRKWNTRHADKETFVADTLGYKYCRIFGKPHRAHRLIWAMHYGEMPIGQIDHINGIRDDNRIENLRLVNNQENNKNKRLSANNTSGVMGVCWDKSRGKWSAQIKVDLVRINLGRFDDIELAIAARKAAEVKYNFHANHGEQRHEIDVARPAVASRYCRKRL
jgi:HNH endonuclease/AP2 domain